MDCLDISHFEDSPAMEEKFVSPRVGDKDSCNKGSSILIFEFAIPGLDDANCLEVIC